MTLNPLKSYKLDLSKAINSCIYNCFRQHVDQDILLQSFAVPKQFLGEFSVHFFRFKKVLKLDSVKSAEILTKEFNSNLALAKNSEFELLQKSLSKVEWNGPYINFYLKLSYLGKFALETITKVNNFFEQRRSTNQKIMIEYSQPNTHKAFHVGHMRNVAIGDSLVRLYKHMGHNVTAVNYFGDEGAHVAKCIWMLRKVLTKEQIEKIESLKEKRGEFLGAIYTKAVEILDLSTYSCLPIDTALSARVTKIQKPEGKNDSFMVLTVSILNMEDNSDICDIAKTDFSVVSKGPVVYSEGDIVAFVPVGSRFKGKLIKETVYGKVISEGLLLGKSEIPFATQICAPSCKKEKKKFLFPPDTKIGQNLTEIGRVSERVLDAVKRLRENNLKPVKEKQVSLDSITENYKEWTVYDKINFSNFNGVSSDPEGKVFWYKDSQENKTLREITDYFDKNFFTEEFSHDQKGSSTLEKFKALSKEVSETLKALEDLSDSSLTTLFQKTKEWSIIEFKRIYDWLGCHFDHDFFESEVSKGAKELVHEYLEKGVLKRDDGCIGADLSNFGLGFCMLEKSDGTGLYATKDIKLAQIKFDQFNVDQSIYVVDIAQSFHFQQVFATLKLMQYEKVESCFHLAYALVVLPSGKMSSRKGTVIVFSELVEQLEKDLLGRCFSQEKILKNRDYWTDENIKKALHAISVGTIKYGMLNQDVGREIVFNMSEWTNQNGNTGSYLMYQYTRIASILRELGLEEEAAQVQCAKSVDQEDFDLLTHPMDRHLLSSCFRFWDIVETCVSKKNPMTMCTFLYDLSKSFSSWYNLPEKRVKKMEDLKLRNASLCLLMFVKGCLKNGLKLIGVDVLERM